MSRVLTAVRAAYDALRPYRKTIAALLGPSLTGLVMALLPGSPGGWAVTSGEWSAIGATTLATVAAVFKVRNLERQLTPASRTRKPRR